MSIISNNPANLKHNIKVVNAEQVPCIKRDVLESLVNVKSLKQGKKEKNTYIINLGMSLSYPALTQDVQVFEQFIGICRMKGYSLLMIKFKGKI